MSIAVNSIHNMDCIEGMKLIEDNSIDLIVTDPPYKLISGGDSKNRNMPKGTLDRKRKLTRQGKLFTENDIKFSDWLPECYRILKEKTHIYVMCNDRNMQELLEALKSSKFKLVNILVWKKNNVTPNKFYMKNCEFIVMARKGGERWINNKGTKQCIEVHNIIGNKKHPTEKPLELMSVLIENSSNVNDTVLDPFMGSGSTAIACVSSSRQYLGFELDSEYWQVSQDRLNEYENF